MTTKLRFSVRPQKTVEVEEEVKTWDTWARKCTRSSNSPYINQALSCPFAKVLPNKLVLLPEDQENNSFVLIRKLKENVFSCTKCHDSTSIENMNEKADLNEIVKQECKHSEVARIIDEKRELENVAEEKIDNCKDQIYNITTEPVEVNVVYPKYTAKAKPGVVVKSKRMTKRRCKTCKGREGCIHLCIFLQAEKEELIKNMGSLRLKEKEAAENKTEIKSDVITGKKFKVVQNKNDLKSSKGKKVLSPHYYRGTEANVFGQEFKYPPTNEEKNKNNQINKVECLFPEERMVPEGLNEKKCTHENIYNETELESRKPIIHHGKPTQDSRDVTLAVYYLKTGKCQCRIYYPYTSRNYIFSHFYYIKTHKQKLHF